MALSVPGRSRSRRQRRGDGGRRRREGSDRQWADRGHERDRAAGSGADAAGAGQPLYSYPAPYGYATAYYPGHPGMHGAFPPQQQPQSRAGDDGVSEQVSGKFLMRNDYCQSYVDSGLRPHNFLRDLDYEHRYAEYPKIERLIKLKDEILAKRATPAMSLKCDLKDFDLNSLGTKFDVILVDPPWEEYNSRVVNMYVPNEDLSVWTMDELRQLKVGEVADKESFVFLWCGETHLEQGRELVKRWGFRRVEDICWVKTNRTAKLNKSGKVERPTLMYGDTSILQRAKEHCIVGVRGTLKRSVDTHFLHANCDVDLIMEEEKEFGSTAKPTELYETIEHFCLGRRRLELFGLDRNMRDGWLTLGSGLTTSNWNQAAFVSWFEGDACWPEVQDYRGGKLVGSVPEIDVLRPKSPVRPGRGRSRSKSPLGRGRRGNRGAPRDAVPEGLLPEDLGELAPALPKDDQDLPPMPAEAGRYK